MAQMYEFDPFSLEENWDRLSREELLERLQAVRALLAQLNEEEPEEMDSEAYEQWGDRHEALEDLSDEIEDRIDEMEGSL